MRLSQRDIARYQKAVDTEIAEEHGAKSNGTADGEGVTPDRPVTVGLRHEALTEAIIGAAIDVHRAMGPGLLESVYEEFLCAALVRRDLTVRRQVPVPLVYEGVRAHKVLRLDIVVAETVVVEVKAVERLTDLHSAQLLTYMRLAELPVGLLINFNVRRLRDGLARRVL